MHCYSQAQEEGHSPRGSRAASNLVQRHRPPSAVGVKNNIAGVLPQLWPFCKSDMVPLSIEICTRRLSLIQLIFKRKTFS